MGYLSGWSPSEPGGPARLWVNGAFNSGNSGGPLMLAETGEVIGIVSAKLAPIPPTIESALKALGSAHSGFVYPATKPDGTKEDWTEAQVVAAVLQYLRSQTQLVVGMAVPWSDVEEFMRANKVISP